MLSSLAEGKAVEPGLGLAEGVGSKRKACSDSSSSEVAPQAATLKTTTTSSTANNNDTNIDSARARYLARQQQHGNKR